MAIKSQVEKGAVDCVTGSSQYTINASTILRQKIQYDRIKVRAAYLDKPAVEIEVNTCDSISQVVAAILFAFGETNKVGFLVCLLACLLVSDVISLFFFFFFFSNSLTKLP